MKLKENLEEKYVAFLDVLGFKQMVMNQNTNLLEEYFNTVKATLIDLKGQKKNIDSLLISDSTILIAENTQDSFKTLVRAVQTIQFRLIQKNIWLRGAISFGDVYFDKEDNLVVGNGLVKAYLLESKAIYPRVIIDSSIIPKIARNRIGFIKYLNPNLNEGEYNVLKLVHDYKIRNSTDDFFVSFGHRVIIEAIEDRSLKRLYTRLKKDLYSNHNHYKKYVWIKNYLTNVLEEILEVWTTIEIKPKDVEYAKKHLISFSRL